MQSPFQPRLNMMEDEKGVWHLKQEVSQTLSVEKRGEIEEPTWRLPTVEN